MSDPVAEAKACVEAYLERSIIPAPQSAVAYVVDNLTITFTSGRQFSSPAGPTAFNAKRYFWMKKQFLRTDADTGNVHV